MRAIIIEDENLTARRLQSLLEDCDPAIQVAAVLPSVAESVDWLRRHGQPDLIFMDIHLEDDLAFRIFEQVDVHAPVIFTTAYDEYMIRAFKVNSIDYLLKPVNPDELAQAVGKFKALRAHFANPHLDSLLQFISQKEPAYKSRFMIPVGTKLKSIETKDVAYFFSEEKLTFLVTKDGHQFPIDYSLEKLIGILDPKYFFRVSRQFIVSFGSIQQVHTYIKGKLKLELHPKSRLEVLVSGDRMTDFKEWLGR